MSLSILVRNRLAFLRWPLDRLAERNREIRGKSIVNSGAEEARYPIRTVRYWWAHCALLEELKRQGGALTIADVGCSTGHTKEYVGEIPGTRWIGLDWKIRREELAGKGYEATHECDFDAPLPLPDETVNAIIFLHVIEHLPRPEFTIRELARILKPGGVIFAGSPVAPPFIARLRTVQLRSRLARGVVKAGGHINSMSGPSWRKLVNDAGLDVEIYTGTFLFRWSKNPLENSATWMRLNQAWGALFPSWGGELYLSARKRAAK
jgi:SAM-dependent methyltransferase